ncbi:MAG: aminotransferase class V-fold PLP-dependent enzyme [Solirubrobacterales bacterium]|nr:aminotransferase class V-fold PLP-dependent enzyme [Solirubrobacterales bacterium]MBV9535188.1 aminotransferase class V-fold PLP-dependent enzyme [Solirubrobacterales bacterium]
MSDAASAVSGGRHLQFPALEEMCYLNTASIGLMPLSAQLASERFARQLGLYGTTWFDEPTEVGALDAARRTAAALLKAPVEQVAITTSMTEAMSQIAWSLRPPTGTNVVSVDFEFPSVPYPWMRVARETGAKVRLVPASEHPGELSLEAVAEVVDEATEVISLSHVQYSTGYRFELGALADLAARHGAWFVVDATQSMGAVSLDLSDGQIDAMLCAGYKWLCGPFGAAICYIGRRLLERLDPPFVGWKSAQEPYTMDASRLRLARSPVERLEYSTMAYGAGVALASSIDYVRSVGVEKIQEHNLRLGAVLHDGLVELGAEVLSTREDGHRTGIVTARFPGLDGEEVAGWLNQSGIIVSPRFGSTRLSVHFYNTDEDVALALRTIRAILQRRGPVAPERSGRGAGP